MSQVQPNHQEKRGMPKRIILVDRELQFRYARAGVGVGVISSAFTSLLILYPLYYFKILVIPNFLPSPILATIVLALLANIILVAFFGLIVSHRIAGPVYSFVKKLRFVQDGKFNNRVDLRPQDDLKFLAKHINETFTALTEQTKRDLSSIDRILEIAKGKEDEKTNMIVGELELLQKRLLARIQ